MFGESLNSVTRVNVKNYSLGKYSGEGVCIYFWTKDIHTKTGESNIVKVVHNKKEYYFKISEIEAIQSYNPWVLVSAFAIGRNKKDMYDNNKVLIDIRDLLESEVSLVTDEETIEKLKKEEKYT